MPISTSPAGRLAGRRIIVTGAASGIGEATAELFIAEGAKVAVLDRSGPAIEACAARIGAVAIGADITDAPVIKEAFESAAAALGGLDGLVNSAGIYVSESVEETALESWRKLIDVNLTGTFICCQAALPHLRTGQKSSIVNLGSGTGLVPTPARNAAYAASKGGVISLSKALAIELAPIRVNVVCPGAVNTPMTAGYTSNPQNTPLATALNMYALKRQGQAIEIARAILYLISDEASYTTGTVLAVDGGRTYH